MFTGVVSGRRRSLPWTGGRGRIDGTASDWLRLVHDKIDWRGFEVGRQRTLLGCIRIWKNINFIYILIQLNQPYCIGFNNSQFIKNTSAWCHNLYPIFYIHLYGGISVNLPKVSVNLPRNSNLQSCSEIFLHIEVKIYIFLLVSAVIRDFQLELGILKEH